MPPKLSPQEFVSKWRDATLKERSAAQEHFIDLCRLVGHDTPAEADPTGERFTFEAGASKQQGGQGWADVWKKGFFAWEYKGKHAGLDKAYEQLDPGGSCDDLPLATQRCWLYLLSPRQTLLGSRLFGDRHSVFGWSNL